MKKLYIEGHHVKKGFVVSLELTDAPVVHYYNTHNLRLVRRKVERFNRMQEHLSKKTCI